MFRAFGIVLLLPALCCGQDMPLFTWAKNGEGWTKQTGPVSVLQGQTVREIPEQPGAFELREPNTNKSYRWNRSTTDGPNHKPTCCISSKDGGTVFVGFEQSTAIYAYQVQPDGVLVNGDAYAPLRVRLSYDNSQEALKQHRDKPQTLRVSALLRDKDGRIYAATRLGVQVFDPTGRPSGNLPLPVAIEPTGIRWNNKKSSMLELWTDMGIWERELLTTKPN